MHEDLEMYKEEARRLKDYLNVLTLQNEELKRQQEQTDNLHLQKAENDSKPNDSSESPAKD